MCVLRVYGKKFDAKSFARRTKLPVSTVHVRRETTSKRRAVRSPKRPWSGIAVRVSAASWDDLPNQVRDAERFLLKYQRSLARLGRQEGVELFVLDFPINLRIGKGRGGRRVVIQSDRFPSTLVAAAARVGLGLELTTYG